MDQEQREILRQEAAKLDALRLDHAKLTAKVDFVEQELRSTKTEAASRFERLENKLDSLFERFDSVSSEVKLIGMKVGAITVGIAMALQLVLKHFGLL